MSGIFLNFRSSDAGSYAAVLLDVQLSGLFGGDLVFRSSRSIRAGCTFDVELLAALEHCDVLLALIGPQWLAALKDAVSVSSDPAGSASSEDWVIKEISIALQRGIRLIPVLLTSAELPSEADLPPEIAPLARRQAVHLRHRHFDSDFRHLLGELADACPGLFVAKVFAQASALPVGCAPSMLLRPEYGIVPFAGREPEITGLHEWAADRTPISAHLVTAPAGQGKTRLGLRLCDLLRDEGWLAGLVAEDAPVDVISRVASAPMPLLLVVDYTEGRTVFLAKATAAIIARRAPAAPTRLLMLARSAGEWLIELREHPDDRVAEIFMAAVESRLGPLTSGGLDRQAEFVRALGALSRELGYNSDYLDPPPGLDGASHGRVLDIHAAALATLLDEHAPGQDSSDPAWDPVVRVLHHEYRYWRRTTAVHELPDPSRARLNAVVAAATLFGAASGEQAAELLGGLPTFRGQLHDVITRYVTWAGRLYPGPLTLNPLRPDRLGEDHVASALRDEPEIIAIASQTDDAQLRQAVTVLGRAAPRHGGLVDSLRVMAAATGRRFIDQAVDTATQLTDPRPLSQVLREAVDADPGSALADFLLDRLPDSSIALADLAVLANERALEAHLQLARRDPAVTAHLMNRLARRLRQTGQANEALLAITEAAEIYRQLVLADQDTYLPHFVGSMHIRSVCLSDTGELAEALATSQVAVAGYRQLADVRPDAFNSELANAMTALSNRFRALGRRQEATAAATKAAALYVKLWEETPSRGVMADMARSLHNLGVHLRESGQVTFALEVLEDALGPLRQMAEQSPDIYLSELASSLNAQANCLDDLGQPEEAAAVCAETVEIYRWLAEHRPEMFQRDLGMSLNNQAIITASTGQLEAALEAAVEAVDVYRSLALANPELYNPDLAMALTSLSQRLGAIGQKEKALEAAAEAVEVRRHSRADDTVEMRGLAVSLTNLAIRLRALNRHADAAPAAQEAVQLLRVCSEREPAYVLELADALNGLALAMIRVGKTEQALAAGLESVEKFRALRADQPELYGRQLASALVHCARAVEDTDSSRAVGLLTEAQEVCDPARYSDLAELIANNLQAMRAYISHHATENA